MGKLVINLTSKDSEGNEKKLVIKKPGHKQMTDAQFYSASIFNKARDSGMMLKDKLDSWLEEQKLFTKEDKQKVKELEQKIEDGELALTTKKHPDGKPVKLSEGRQIAIDMNLARIALRVLYAKKQVYDEFTVEGQVENARFDYLVSTCVYDEEGNLVFTDVEDYYDKKEEPYASEAAFKLMGLVFGVDDDWQKKTIENQFLLKYKFVDDNLNFINKDGEHVNAKGEKVVAENKEQPEITTEFEDDIYAVA